MSLPKTVWTFSVDEFTKRADADIEARLSPWTDRNKSARFRFAYLLTWTLLCSDNPEKVKEIIGDWQRIKSINSQQLPAGPTAGKGADKLRDTAPPPRIDGFMGHSVGMVQ